jgi:hypothetical protein
MQYDVRAAFWSAEVKLSERLSRAGVSRTVGCTANNLGDSHFAVCRQGEQYDDDTIHVLGRWLVVHARSELR